MKWKARTTNQLLAFAAAFLLAACCFSAFVHLTVLAQEGTVCYTCSTSETCIEVNDGWESCYEFFSGGERTCHISGDECHALIE